MNKLTKRRETINKLVNKDFYSLDDGIKVLQETSTAKFIESAEAHIALNIDPKYSDQQLRTTVILPKGTGKTKRIALLLPNEKISSEYQDLANIVGSDDLIESMSKGEINFDILISTPDMMPKLAKLGRILGPKGLMPSPKAGTVTTDIKTTLLEFKQGKVEYRADRTGIVHLSFGKVNFLKEDLLENLKTVYNSIEQNKPSGVKGRYFKTFYICSTMGPSIPIELAAFK